MQDEEGPGWLEPKASRCSEWSAFCALNSVVSRLYVRECPVEAALKTVMDLDPFPVADGVL